MQWSTQARVAFKVRSTPLLRMIVVDTASIDKLLI